MLTSGELLKKPITMLFNRDNNGVSKGTVFLDTGISRKELSNESFEHYTITHKSAKSIQFQLTDGTRGAQDESLHRLDKVMILDAEDIQDTDFACVFNLDGSIQELEVYYNSS